MPTPLPPGFHRDASSTPLPPGFHRDTDTQVTIDQPLEDPPNSIIGGGFRRALSLLEGTKNLTAPPNVTSIPTVNAGIGAALGPILPAYRMAKGVVESGREGLNQARQEYQEAAQVHDPLTRFLMGMRAVNTGIGSINPLTSGTVTNINKLEDEGRSREAIGQGGLDAALLLLGGTRKGRDISSDIADHPISKLRVTAQEAAGAGKEPVLKAERARVEAIENAKAKATEQSKRFVQREHAARQAERGAEAASAQKQVIARGQRAYAKLIDENLRSTQKAVAGELRQRWSNLDDKMEIPVKSSDGGINTSPVAGKPIRGAIEQARNEYLVGSPKDLTDFNNLMGRLSDPSIDSAEYAKPLGWKEARTHYTNINNRLFAGELPPNVYKALELVKNSLDEQLGKAASARGLGPEYTGLKRDWSQYKSDFDDVANMSTGGGSPLARAIRFQSPADLEKLLNSQYGDNLLQRVSRYRDKGANPQIIDKYRQLGRRAEAIESPKPVAHPQRPPIAKLPPEIVPYEIRLRKLEEYSGRPASIWDIYPPRFIERLMLKSPAMREWIARQPRKELQP